MALVLALVLFGAAEWCQKGIAALKAGNVVEAVKLAPGEPVMWLAVADARLLWGGGAGAVALVLALLLFGAEEWLQKGIAALKAGNVVEARAALEEAVKLAPGEPVMWLAVADARLRSGEAGLAVEAMEQAGRLAPGSPMVERGRDMFARRMGEVGQGLLDARQEKRAEAVLQVAVKAFPKQAELWRLLGLALYAQGRNAAAVTAFVAAIDLAPEEESLYAGLETLLPGGGRWKRGWRNTWRGTRSQLWDGICWAWNGAKRRCGRRLGRWMGSFGRRRLRCINGWSRGGRWSCWSGWLS